MRRVDAIVDETLHTTASMGKLIHAAAQLKQDTDAHGVTVLVVQGFGNDVGPRTLCRHALAPATAAYRRAVAALSANPNADPYTQAVGQVAAELPTRTDTHPSIVTGTRSHFISNLAWREHPFVKSLIKPANVGPCVTSVVSLGALNTHLIMNLFKGWSDPGFSGRQCDIIDSVIRGLVPAVVEDLEQELKLGVCTSPSGVSGIRNSLSRAQSLVLDLLIKGYDEQQVADRLYRSKHTIHSHIRAIYRAVGARSRAQLLAMFVNTQS